MLFFNLSLILIQPDEFPQRSEYLNLSLFVALTDRSLLNLHEESLLHFNVFKHSVSFLLLDDEAPAAENMCFVSEYMLSEGLVNDKLEPARVKLQCIKGLGLALTHLPLNDRVQSDH